MKYCVSDHRYLLNKPWPVCLDAWPHSSVQILVRKSLHLVEDDCSFSSPLQSIKIFPLGISTHINTHWKAKKRYLVEIIGRNFQPLHVKTLGYPTATNT